MEYNFIFDVKFLNEKKASADMEFTIEIPQAILATINWADENGNDLEEYLPIKSLGLVDGKGTYKVEMGLMIPEKAAKIRCHVFNDAMIEIKLPELIKEIPEEKRLKESVPVTKIFATSDIHVGGEYFHNTENRIKAFDYIRDTKPELILITGDITDNSNVNEFETARNLLSEKFEGIPVFVCTGNHDLSPYKPGCFCHHEEMTDFFKWQCERNASLGATVGELNKRYYYCGTYNGKQVSVVNSNDEGNKFYVEDEQCNWLEKNLCESDGARYRFVITHFHQKNTVSVLPHLVDKSYFADNDRIKEMLERHGNIIHVSGHTHTNFDMDVANTYFDKEHKILYINAGCAVWNGVGMSFRREYYLQGRCTGQLIEVYEDYVITRGIDFVSGKIIPRCLHLSEM